MRSATQPKLRTWRQICFPPRRKAKISVNTSLIAHSLSLPPMYLRRSCYDIAWLGSRSNSNIRNSACVDGLYECISSRGWDIEHCSIPPPLLDAPANGNQKSISLSESEHHPSARGRNSPVFRIPRNFSNSDLITVNIMRVLTSFVIKVFSVDRDL